MPHGGIIDFNSPVECFLNIKMPLPPGGSYPREPPFSWIPANPISANSVFTLTNKYQFFNVTY